MDDRWDDPWKELEEQLEIVQRELSLSNPSAFQFTREEEKPVEREGSSKILNGSYARISDDKMVAWIYLYPPRENQTYSVEKIKNYLRSQGIVNGFHESNLHAMVKKRIYDREVIVANGKPSELGADGYYEYFFSPEKLRSPKVREDGTVDYSSMSMLQNVGKNDKIAIYHPATKGVPGYNVKGEEIGLKPARELPPIRGKNIARLDDGITYISLVDGKVEAKNGRVDVQNTHEIRGDVTLITGRVEFYGDVVIKGNVEAGVMIRAGRNIVISGIVEGVSMYAGGDIILQTGISGGNKAKISARGDLFADFIENTNVMVGGSVQANSIMNSNVSADGKVTVTGKRGALIGGYTHGLLGVEATIIGNESEVKTIVHAGYDARTYERYLHVHKKELEVQAELAKAVDEMSAILKERRTYGNKMDSSTEHKLLLLNKQKDECFAELENTKADKEILVSTIENGKGASIKVKGSVYRGTIICIETVQMPLERGTSFIKYSVQNGLIEGRPILR